MITRRTKIQLVIFVVITLVGVSYVGARYAQLDRLVRDEAFTVVAHFTESGGIYEGAEVNYRGVKIGEVGEMTLTDAGVDVDLEIDRTWDRIPADSLALVGNRSAVGEQYVELQPDTKGGPYLEEDSEIDRTDTPLPTEKLLADAATTIGSVDKKALRTSIDELGTAFQGTGRDLQQILDTGTSFIDTANDNFALTRDLLRDGNTVLEGQLASESAIRGFAEDFAKFSGTLRRTEPDIVRLLETGSTGANELRTFLQDNKVDIEQLLSRVVTTGKLVKANLPALRHMLVVYPYVVEGGFTVADRDPVTGEFNAHFGLVLTHSPLCEQGYESTDRRSPYDREDRKINTKAHCAEPPSQATARGAQNHPRAAADYRAPTNIVGGYDRRTGELEWGSSFAGRGRAQAAPATLGADAWEWLYLQPLAAGK